MVLRKTQGDVSYSETSKHAMNENSDIGVPNPPQPFSKWGHNPGCDDDITVTQGSQMSVEWSQKYCNAWPLVNIKVARPHSAELSIKNHCQLSVLIPPSGFSPLIWGGSLNPLWQGWKKRSFSQKHKKRFNNDKKKNVITQTRLVVLWNEVPTHILTL